MFDLLLAVGGLGLGLFVGWILVRWRARERRKMLRLVIRKSARDRFYYCVVGVSGKVVAISTRKFPTEAALRESLDAHLGSMFPVDREVDGETDEAAATAAADGDAEE